MTPQENIAATYRLALEEGLEDKAEILESFMEELEEYHVRETHQVRSNMVRERPVRKARSTSQQQRA
jgi:hypothetical protein